MNENNAPFRDRSGRIRGMGIFQIVLGSLCGLLTLILVLTTVLQTTVPSSMGREQPSPIASLAFSMIIYLALAASLIWVGVGALKLRRWVPKVVLAVNWPFLVIGAIATAGAIWFMPLVMRISIDSAAAGAAAGGAPALSSSMSEGIVTAATVVAVVVLFVIYVLIPGLHVILFHGRDVQETCDVRDPTPRWTDDLPTSVVALVVWLGASSLSWVGMGLIGFGALFGLVLTGVPALLLGVLYAAVSVVLARWVARRSSAAWWATVAFFAVMFAGSLSTFFLLDLGELYRRSGLLSEHQIVAMEPAMGAFTNAARILGAACGAAIFVFMAVVRKHFGKSAAGGPG
jgi:hypothetical protein